MYYMKIIIKIRKQVFLGLVSFVLFFFVACYITYPLIFNISSLVTGFGDELLIAMVQNWDIHIFLSGNITNIFNANIYFPYLNSLAYSETFISSSLVSFIPLIIYKEPIVTVNFTFILSIILLGISIYLLCHYLTNDFLVSTLSGLLITFSPAVLSYYVHLQILFIWCVPLSILYFLKFINIQRSNYLIYSLIFFLLQMYNSFLPGYFIVFSFIIILIFYFINYKKKTLKLISKKNIILCLTSFILTLPVIIPYYMVSKEFNYSRDIRDSIHLGLEPEDLLCSSPFSRFHPFLNQLPINQKSQNNEFKPGYLGFIFSLLSLIALLYFIKNFRRNSMYFNCFGTIGLFGLILSLGPALHFNRQTVHLPFPIPLPYALFYYLVPGFQGFRNSARWEMLFILCMSIIIAILLNKLLKNKPIITRVLIYLVLMVGIIAEFNFPMRFYNITLVKDFPKVYSWLNTTPAETKIIEMPIYNWNMQFNTELQREYYSTIHFRKMVNGYSGFSPPPWQNLVVEISQEFPDEKAIIRLKKIGINYIIVHKNEYDILFKNKIKVNSHLITNGNSIIHSLNQNKKLHFIKKFENDYIYKI